jgi:hypothetical protein
MDKLIYGIIGFILGIAITIYLCIEELVGEKLTLEKIKKLWKILNE